MLGMILIWIGLSVGNFIWCAMSSTPFKVGLERAYFQGMAILTVALVGPGGVLTP